MNLKNLDKRDFFLFAAGVILTIIIFNITVFKIYWVPSDSMENTIKENDFVYVYQLPYLMNYGEPAYGDIMVFKYPLDEKYVYVKRLLGKPGDVIHIEKNKLFRNNIEVSEPYLHSTTLMEDFGPVTVQEKSYFFMGDNRNRSYDSREWGVVKYSQIKGKVIKVLWP